MGVLMQQSLAGAGIDITVKREPADGYWSEVWMTDPWVASYYNGRPTADWMLASQYSSGQSTGSAPATASDSPSDRPAGRWSGLRQPLPPSGSRAGSSCSRASRNGPRTFRDRDWRELSDGDRLPARVSGRSPGRQRADRAGAARSRPARTGSREPDHGYDSPRPSPCEERYRHGLLGHSRQGVGSTALQAARRHAERRAAGADWSVRRCRR